MNLKKHFALLTLLFFSVVLSAQVKEKMITISFSKIPLSEAMARIEKTSGYTFFYDATQVNVKQEVSLNVKQVPVSKAVGEMLKGSDQHTDCLVPQKEYSGTDGQGDYNHR